jgi:pilus assembly protein Flp/PilA
MKKAVANQTTQFRELIAGYLITLRASSMASVSLKQDEGQTLAEYALILALIAIIVIVVVATLGSTISGIFNNVSTSI